MSGKLRNSTIEQKSLVTSKQRITKSSMKEVNPGTITGTLSWYKISPLSGIRVIPKLPRRQGDGEEFMKVPRAVAEANSY